MNPRRTGAAAVAAIVLALPLAAGSAPQAPDDAIVDGAGLAAAAVAVGAANPDFDFWPAFSTSSIDNEASHGLSAAVWPGFLIDAFFWLYGFQTTERAMLGISETQWPNPPHESSASSSTFAMNNFANGCGFVFGPGPAADACRQAVEPFFNDPPGAAGASRSRSGPLSTEGSARGTRFAYPGILEADEVRTETSSRFVDGRTLVESTFTARDVRIGADLRIATLEAVSVAGASGAAQGSEARSTLRLAGVTWAGQEAVVDDQGVHLTADRSSDAPNEALAAQGLEVRLARGREDVAGDGQFANAATGGLSVRLARERAEEAFPFPAGDVRRAACAAADGSPINQEITRIRVDEANPLFGRVPFAPLPERLVVDQSVPPPFACPFLNRSLEVALVLGLTEASARLSPLPRVDSAPAAGPAAPPSGDDVVATTVLGGAVEPTAPARAGGRVTASAGAAEVERTRLAAAFSESDVARRLRLLYGLLVFVGALALAGRFAFRTISSP